MFELKAVGRHQTLRQPKKHKSISRVGRMPQRQFFLVHWFDSHSRSLSNKNILHLPLAQPDIGFRCNSPTILVLYLGKKMMANCSRMTDDKILEDAVEAARKGEIGHALARAKEIKPVSSLFLEAFRLRLQLCLQDLRILQRERFGELLELLQIVADNPTLLEARAAMETFFEESLEEPFARAVLASLLFTFGINRIKSYIKILKAGKPLRHDFSELREEIDETAFAQFMDTAIQSLSGKHVIGSGELLPKTKELIQPSYVKLLIEILENQEGIEDLGDAEVQQTRVGALQMLALVCKHLGDPSSDFLGLHFLIQYFAAIGKTQDARDLAETGLLSLRNTQSTSSNFRTSLAWFCFAEAFNRSSNPLAAARCYILSIFAGREELPTVGWLNRYLRLSYQICRNLHLLGPASEFLNLRREVVKLSVKEPSASLIQQLDAEELSLALFEAGSSESKQFQVLDRAIKLLKKEIKDEEQSIIATACNAIRILRSLRHPIPDGFIQEIRDRLAAFRESLRRPLETMIKEDVNAQDIRAMLANVFPANHSTDLASAVTIMIPASLNALSGACERKDSDTFFVINNILCQPSLAPTVSSTEELPRPPTEWHRMLASGERDPNKLSEAYLNSSYDQISKVSFSDLRDLTTADCQRLISAEEVVVQACADDGLNLYQMIIGKDRIEPPEKITDDVWSSLRYWQWRETYPVRYSDWQPPEPFKSEVVFETEVADSLRKLSIKSPIADKSVVIVPPPALFGFPFNMTIDRHQEMLFKRSSVSIAPSVPWLIKARSETWTRSLRSKAWLGAPTTPDIPLQWLRSKLTNPLNAFNIEIINESPVAGELCEIELAIIASHGGTGFGGYFNSVDDRVSEMPPAQFAAQLRGTGCVVLFVCSAGVAHQKFMTAEALGLVASLLRADVRCVVGCPWPVPLDLPPMWIRPFLSAFDAGKSAAQAAFEAAAVVRSVHSNPCAWAAFHVYGDGSFSKNLTGRRGRPK